VGPIGPSQNFNPDRLADIVPAAHARSKPILFSVGGWGNTEFSDAIRPGVRATLVASLVEAMTDWGFDGVDVDMEPINASDHDNYAEFVRVKGIGGMIIWELSGGYRSDQPGGQRDRLLQAVKTAAF
jgi:GH18 family chitinase